MKIVIRAGGTGTRLWPMSRVKNPKQFQKIVGDKSMIRTTYERVSPLLADTKDLFISVNKSQEKTLKIEVPEVDDANIILETDTRNTGPAMCLEVCFLERFCDSCDVIASLPSDDYISDSEAFRDLLSKTEEFIKANPDYILTPAVKPDYPDTGYSYLKAGKNLQADGEEAIYEVADVVEKPNLDYLEELIKSGIYYSHTGMYLWRLGHISELFQKFQPNMYKICKEVVALTADGKMAKAQKLYGQLEKVSVESAITDKAKKIAMSVSNQVGWSDLGKWHVIKRVIKKEESENLIKGTVFANQATNNLIYSTDAKKVVVVNDVNDLAIVDTGDVLFVSSLKNSAEVKKLVDELKKEGLEKYL